MNDGQLSMEQAYSMIVAIRHPHAPRRHGHHTFRTVELPECGCHDLVFITFVVGIIIASAPGPRIMQHTDSALQQEPTD